MQEPIKLKLKIATRWELITYDVWGNAHDGWEVNNAFTSGKYYIPAVVTVYNVGTPQEFEGAELTIRAVRKALQLSPKYRVQFDDYGDDTHYYFCEPNGKPALELRCISHESLSPIRKKTK